MGKNYFSGAATVRRFFALFICVCISMGALAATEPRPNIVVILADDMGIGDAGVYGCTDIPTPHIDSIAANGVKMLEGYVTAPQCGPSRAGLISGRYQQRFGYEFNANPHDADCGMSTEEKSLATRLKAAGYTSAIIGKWHLGAGKGLLPQDRGFDYFYGIKNGMGEFFPPYRWATKYLKLDQPSDIFRNGKSIVETADYFTDALRRECVGFIDRSKARPFFLYASFTAPHVPLQATQKYLDRVGSIEDKDRRTYAAMMVALDDAVGDILDTLKQNGLWENTLLFFISDNGAAKGAGGSNSSFQGYKGSLYEGGIRVPYLVQWPGTLPAGKDYAPPVSTLDVAATAVALAGADAVMEPALEGVNLVPYLTGAAKGAPHKVLFYKQYAWNDSWAVRRGAWMLYGRHGIDQPAALYNVEKDPQEKNDLSAQFPERVGKLTAQWKQWHWKNIDPAWEYKLGQ